MICLPCSSLLFDLKYTPTRAHSDTPYSHNYTLTQSIIQTHTHTEAHVNTQISNQIVIFLAGGPARLPSLLDSELFTPPWDTARSFLCPSLCEPQFTFWKMRTAHPGCLTGPPWKPSERPRNSCSMPGYSAKSPVASPHAVLVFIIIILHHHADAPVPPAPPRRLPHGQPP